MLAARWSPMGAFQTYCDLGSTLGNSDQIRPGWGPGICIVNITLGNTNVQQELRVSALARESKSAPELVVLTENCVLQNPSTFYPFSGR
jgi:hypothetical protein